MGKHERAAFYRGVALSPFSMIGTICLEVKTGAPYLKFRPIIRQQLGYGAPAGVRRLGGTGRQPVHYGSWPWGGKSPLASLVYIARPPMWEKSRRTRRPAPRMMLGAVAIQLWRGSTPLIYQGHKTQKFGLAYRQFFKYFFIFSKPRSTARRTALSSTPSSSATSQ